MFRFPIICGGGIGDSLLKIAAVPVERWGRLGLRFNIFYDTKDHPAGIILKDLFENINYCQFVQRKPNKIEYRIRNIWSKHIIKTSKIFAPPINLLEDALPNLKAKAPRLLVQSHLDGHHGWKGATAKMWSVERWCEFCKSIHNRGWDVAVLEWNPESLAALQKSCPFIQDARKSNFSETICSFRNYQCMVSVDSWSKYVAAWWKIPQVVIVPNLRIGYTPDFERISAEQIATQWFRGLTDAPNIRLVGLERIDGHFNFTLPSIHHLDVLELIKAVEFVLRPHPKIL